MGSTARGATAWPRRRFLAASGATVAGMAVAGTTLFILRDDSGRAVAHFDVAHDPSVYVTMTAGSPFVVEVKDRATRAVLEHHDGVTAENLLALDSDHVVITQRRDA